MFGRIMNTPLQIEIYMRRLRDGVVIIGGLNKLKKELCGRRVTINNHSRVNICYDFDALS